jgi:putative IMPACT (imprinted ancient) family translation regulator
MPSEHAKAVQQKVDYIIEQALDRAYNQIHDQIIDDDYNRDDAWYALSNWDLEDHFSDWWEEGIE